MINNGSIVYFEEFIFRNNVKDNKLNRPCVVIEKTDEEVICVPLTSQIKSFNNHNYKYCLIPTVIYDYKKMSFASLQNLTIRNIEEANETGIVVSNEVVERIINKINENSYLFKSEYIEKLNNVHREHQLEEKHQKNYKNK